LRSRTLNFGAFVSFAIFAVVAMLFLLIPAH
jgi:ABC-type multidrug transport system permease subunit